MSEPLHLLFSSAGRRVALMNLFRDSLAELGRTGKIFAVDMSPWSSACRRADQYFQVPPCTSHAFVPTMLDLCRRHRIDLLIPTIDTELPVYAANRARFAAIGTTVLVSDADTIAISANKITTHDWLTRHALPTVRQTSVETALTENWQYPLIVKPALGSGGIGVQLVYDAHDLARAARGDETFVVQTRAPGREYTVSLWVRGDGSIPCAVPRLRLEVRAGEVSKARTVRLEPVEALAKRVASLLPGLLGAVNIQVFHDPVTGEMNIIEINPRFGGGFPLAFEAGARFPQWILEDFLELPSTSTSTWQDNLTMLRYDEAVFVAPAAPE